MKLPKSADVIVVFYSCGAVPRTGFSTTLCAHYNTFYTSLNCRRASVSHEGTLQRMILVSKTRRARMSSAWRTRYVARGLVTARYHWSFVILLATLAKIEVMRTVRKSVFRFLALFRYFVLGTRTAHGRLQIQLKPGKGSSCYYVLIDLLRLAGWVPLSWH